MAPRPIHPTRVTCVLGHCGPSAEEVDDVGEGVLVADVAGEHDVGRADDLRAGPRRAGTPTPGRAGAGRARSARRMPRPRTATSCEVMPPLATTQAGSAATAPRTTSMTAVDTVRAISRLAAGSASRSRVRLVNSSTSEPASAPTTAAVTSATCASPAGRVGDGGDVELDLGEAAAVAGHRHLAAGEPDVRADDDQAVPGRAGRRARCPTPAAAAAGPARPGAAGTTGRSGTGTTSRRPRLEQAEDDDVEVGVVDGVDDDERAVGHAGEDLGHPLRAAAADVVEGDAVHLVRP